ncbi:hypothetical protein D3C83_56370 [compost metagenome]
MTGNPSMTNIHCQPRMPPQIEWLARPVRNALKCLVDSAARFLLLEPFGIGSESGRHVPVRRMIVANFADALRQSFDPAKLLIDREEAVDLVGRL